MILCSNTFPRHSHNRHTTPLIRTLEYAQAYTHAIVWRDFDGARRVLEETGAFAEGEDARLRMPKSVRTSELVDHKNK